LSLLYLVLCVNKNQLKMTQTKVLQVEGITAATLLNAVEEIVSRKLAAHQKEANPIEPDFITRQQVADIFKITLPTVHAWSNAGILKPRKIGNKTRYYKVEVLAACKPLPTQNNGNV
jgi:hypothetical protein